MFRKEVNKRSPLRILERSIKGGVGPGNVGVVMARAGVGKTAFLVQIGLDDAMRRRPVLHISIGQELDHVQSWYDALFDHLADSNNLEDRSEVHTLIQENRLIHTYRQAEFSPERLDEMVVLYAERMNFKPQAILIDGFDWESHSADELVASVKGFKSTADKLEAELWISAQTRRAETTDHPTKLTPPCDVCDELIDIAVYLEPEGRHVTVRLLKDHDNPEPEQTHLQLHTDSMQLASDQEDEDLRLPARNFTVLTGGAKGAEQTFGEAAERWGLDEVTYTFAGRDTKRKRGLVVLSEEELERGSVSEAYIKAQLHRSFPKTETFQRILKSIWHVVATAGEVFFIGEIQDDGTVRGGTGWGVELARHFHKRVYVFDQVKEAWYQWKDDAWQSVAAPKIRRTRFAGTGSRRANDAAKKAINELFERSFGDTD